MSHEREPFAANADCSSSYDAVTGRGLIAVHSCSRIGLVANPPTFSLADWFRGARRRRADRLSAA
jgi:hypothetical protein